ncbi:hypothetical protein H920_01017 [Fukomys damarensis]|uniref:Uncharacterized protein n=1 Tax=Fukomys damarensis TaxID=885580 RepID=A0A091E2F3_FUKDA|nr:hypothetical protein H920_01017 [Fukomys damarensis]
MQKQRAAPKHPADAIAVLSTCAQLRVWGCVHASCSLRDQLPVGRLSPLQVCVLPGARSFTGWEGPWQRGASESSQRKREKQTVEKMQFRKE